MKRAFAVVAASAVVALVMPLVAASDSNARVVEQYKSVTAYYTATLNGNPIEVWLAGGTSKGDAPDNVSLYLLKDGSYFEYCEASSLPKGAVQVERLDSASIQATLGCWIGGGEIALNLTFTGYGDSERGKTSEAPNYVEQTESRAATLAGYITYGGDVIELGERIEGSLAQVFRQYDPTPSVSVNGERGIGPPTGDCHGLENGASGDVFTTGVGKYFVDAQGKWHLGIDLNATYWVQEWVGDDISGWSLQTMAKSRYPFTFHFNKVIPAEPIEIVVPYSWELVAPDGALVTVKEDAYLGFNPDGSSWGGSTGAYCSSASSD